MSNRGHVEFRPAPGGRGTEVHVEVAYDPSGGAPGTTVTTLAGEETSRQIAEDLRRLKQTMEAGEITIARGASWQGRPSVVRE